MFSEHLVVVSFLTTAKLLLDGMSPRKPDQNSFLFALRAALLDIQSTLTTPAELLAFAAICRRPEQIGRAGVNPVLLRTDRLLVVTDLLAPMLVNKSPISALLFSLRSNRNKLGLIWSEELVILLNLVPFTSAKEIIAEGIRIGAGGIDDLYRRCQQAGSLEEGSDALLEALERAQERDLAGGSTSFGATRGEKRTHTFSAQNGCGLEAMRRPLLAEDNTGAQTPGNSPMRDAEMEAEPSANRRRLDGPSSSTSMSPSPTPPKVTPEALALARAELQANRAAKAERKSKKANKKSPSRSEDPGDRVISPIIITMPSRSPLREDAGDILAAAAETIEIGDNDEEDLLRE